VKQGKAVLEASGKLRLGESMQQSLTQARSGRPLIPGGGYDSVNRMMKQQEQRRVPIAQLPERPTKRRMVSAIARRGSVRVVYEKQELA
jgi:hypothetical protein